MRACNFWIFENTRKGVRAIATLLDALIPLCRTSVLSPAVRLASAILSERLGMPPTNSANAAGENTSVGLG